MLQSQSLGGVQDDRGNAGRAFVGGRTIDAPGLEQRSGGGIGAASGDPDRPCMRSTGQEGSERDDLFHPAALGHTEKRFRVGAPPLMRLRATEQQQAISAALRMAVEEFAS